MEGFLEVVLSILFIPFQSKSDELNKKINNIKNKFLRVSLKILIILIPLTLLLGLLSFFNFLINGYWI